MKEKHISVLLEESISSLNLKDDSIIVDCTLGYGGHSSNILARIKKGFLFAFDQDSEAIRHSTDRLNAVGTNFTIIKSNFVHLKEKLKEQGVDKVDGVLFDLGVSSPQLDEKERGFSYHEDARLDMRMDKDNPLSAYEVVNNYSKEQLANIFYKYGEDKFSNNIAKKIGLGDNLKDSISETTPIIQSIVATSNAAKSISSYCWAAVGVGLAMQDAWDNFFESISNRKHYIAQKNEGIGNKIIGKAKTFGENSWNISKDFVKALGRSCSQLWNGNPAHKGFMKHSGKALIGFAALATTGLTANAIIRAKNKAKNRRVEIKILSKYDTNEKE